MSMSRAEVGTPLGVLWVDPDERSLRRLRHHLAKPGGFLVTGTGDRFVQAARLDDGLILEYRDDSHSQTQVADVPEVLAAFAEFWSGSTAFLDRYQWSPVSPSELETTASETVHGSISEMLAGTLPPRLAHLGFTAGRTGLRWRHRFEAGDQSLEFLLSHPRSLPKGASRIAARAEIELTEVDDQVAAWGLHLEERPRLTIHSDMCWPDAANWVWSPESDDRFLRASVGAFVDYVVIPLHTNANATGLVSVWDNLGLTHAGTRAGQVGLAAALALAGDHKRAFAVLQAIAEVQDDVGNAVRTTLPTLEISP
jgi:hypothetical protein